MIEEEEDVPGSQDNYLSGDGDATEQTNNEAKSEVSVDKVLDIERFLKDFMSFCSLLPRYYEFSKDILVSQWMTGGLIELGEYKMTEEVYAKCFDTLVEMDYFVPSEYDYIFDRMKYRVGDGKKFDSKMINTSVVEHTSISFKELGVLKQYSCLQTLVIYDSYGVDHLPSDIFSELKTLKILNLSGTNVAALPSSIENLKELRLLDMSKTPIRWLPDTICYFSLLHTLNLDGCLELDRLPKCMNKLTNLQHLVLDMSRLQSIPIGMGNLSKLQTLNMFSVGVDDGRRVTELKDLNKLRGSFSLLNLENIRSKEEASDACLHKKTGLRKIELHWSDIQDEKCESEEEILESLQPPSSTQELKILFYSGGVLPSWICNPSFSELASIVLDECKYCSSLPFLGELPSLKSLSIVENNVLTEIGSSFFRLRANPYREAFPKLEKLSFESMFKLEKWTGFEDGDFPSLRLLIIEYCPVFVGLPFLSRLSSLSGLEIRYCPEFSCLPEDGLPASLESLMIKQSPKLKAQCCDEQWRDWSKVALVPSIYIDDQEFSPKNGVPITS